MWKIRTHRMGIDRGSLLLFSDFQDNGPMWTGQGEREARRAVAFSEPFLSAPVVQVGISMWDADSGRNPRMDIMAENVTPAGFDIVFRTWGDSRIARVRADWLALGEVAHEDDWEITP
ncbi:MAG: hypothetical protein D6801_08895 [Alphaproteobacteria bacterium]|nr:MAG: hypothetical protein D6801_08895 [Alphaproteobacteria bacterium]